MATFLLPFAAGLIIYYLSGYIIKNSSSAAKNNGINPQFTAPVRIVSPFTDVHFISLNGTIRPRHSTIHMLMQHISFRLTEKIHINNLYTGYVVSAEFINVLEHEFEGVKYRKGTLRRTYPKGMFTMSQREAPYFNEYLELLLKIDLWNYYCNKYPEALLHQATPGANTSETEYLL